MFKHKIINDSSNKGQLDDGLVPGLKSISFTSSKILCTLYLSFIK